MAFVFDAGTDKRAFYINGVRDLAMPDGRDLMLKNYSGVSSLEEAAGTDTLDGFMNRHKEKNMRKPIVLAIGLYFPFVASFIIFITGMIIKNLGYERIISKYIGPTALIFVGWVFLGGVVFSAIYGGLDTSRLGLTLAILTGLIGLGLIITGIVLLFR